MNMRNLFGTPKKVVITVLSLIVVIALIILVFVSLARGKAENKGIGKAGAESVALKDAGFDLSQVTLERTEFESENGQYIYDVSFIANGEEYEYWIDAYKGTILSREIEGGGRIYDIGTSKASLEPSTIDTTNPKLDKQSKITLEEAKSIAVRHAGLSISDVTFSEAVLQNDDGIMEYEIEFYFNNKEYSYSIDATNGTILDYESEPY